MLKKACLSGVGWLWVVAAFCPNAGCADAPSVSSPTVVTVPPPAPDLIRKGTGTGVTDTQVPPAPSTPTLTLTLLHPTEGQKLPLLTEVFAYGQVTIGSTLTINGLPVPIHPKGGYLVMVPLKPGENLLHLEETLVGFPSVTLDRHVTVSSGFVSTPAVPLAIEKASVSPEDDVLLMPGDVLRIGFQGSPGAAAQAVMDGIGIHRTIPMTDVSGSSTAARGIYQGSYTLQPADRAALAVVSVQLKRGSRIVHAKAAGRLTIDSGAIPRVGQIVDDMVAVRTAPEGGYDLFLYKGMKVRLTGRMNGQCRVRLSSQQSGWIKESSIQELPAGTPAPACFLTNMTVTHQSESSVVRIPLGEMLPWRVEQTLDPARLVVTVYGAVDRTNLIRYDPTDPLVQMIRWKQITPDTVQLTLDTTLKRWWGYDVRYEGTTLVVEIRSPWKSQDVKGMVIAIDAGHGGSDTGAIGPLGTMEKDTNLGIAIALYEALEKAGAHPFLTRDRDVDVPLQDRGRLAWKAGARLFISIHGNASGPEENPIWNNGYSVYFYHPQSRALADAVHTQYRQTLTNLPDHGLYYDDLAVCRTTQMPAILTEQAFLIVPEQEQMLLDPKFHRTLAAAILNGVKSFLASGDR